ncbi:hypothetical protein [Allobaculum sp. JKK-2023]|uniref:hypothetical protein n=1 Tax=Allobaculum sp. JKK-2023 TaxID=3108943 RepID=UPI002B059694|nr:hypothetical protein [Allobaculum sp. JKK-2023]
MNKKIFAALASATMALSATGSLAVFAEDFDVVTEADGTQNTPTGTVVPASGLVIDSTNFPDDGFRTSLIDYLNALSIKDIEETTPIKYGSRLSKAALDAVTTIAIGDVAGYTSPTATDPTDFYALPTNTFTVTGKGKDQTVKPTDPTAAPSFSTITKSDAVDLTGIEYFSNLETLIVNGAASLQNIDLSANTKVENVCIIDAAKLNTVNLADNAELAELYVEDAPVLNTIDLPGGVNLNNVTVITAPSLDALDLSQNKRLQTVTVQDTNVANLDLSGNLILTDVLVDNNSLNTLNLNASNNIAKLDCSDNVLYSLDLPAVTAALTYIDVSNNVLQKLDFPKLTDVTDLNVSHNELNKLDLSKVSFKNAKLNVSYNHMAALNLTTKQTAGLDVANSDFSSQRIYIAPEYNAVNLKENYEDFDIDSVMYNVFEPSTVEMDYDEGILSNIQSNGAQYNYYVDGSNTGPILYVQVLKADVLNRLYNPNSGEHFYTKDIEEKDVLVGLGWQDEGIGWTSPVESSKPVYRLYNPNAGDHHYTMNSAERDTLVTYGWKYEGIGWYSYTGSSNEIAFPAAANVVDNTMPQSVVVYREYNPNAKAAGAHNYTVNAAENDFLVSVGWLEEGTAWNAIK